MSTKKSFAEITELTGLDKGIEEISLVPQGANGEIIAISKEYPAELIESLGDISAAEKSLTLEGDALAAAQGICRIAENFKDVFGAAELAEVAKALGLAQEEKNKVKEKETAPEAPPAAAPVEATIPAEIQKELANGRAELAKLQKELREERAARRSAEISKEAEELSVKEAAAVSEILKAFEGEGSKEIRAAFCGLVSRFEAEKAELSKLATREIGGAAADLASQTDLTSNVDIDIQKIMKEKSLGYVDASKEYFRNSPEAYEAFRAGQS